MQKIRLSEFYREAIIKAFKGHFGADDHLWIFGSRVDTQQKGGDIDLYIKTQEVDARIANKMRAQYHQELWKILGEQRIDIVLNIYPFELKLPIYEIAENGVLLV
ncbi:MAG: DNA polymerase III subunit beta [Rickettsiales bacterium]|nr:MAG: DNA polymerase III subunit beta [Rickettsiales bacterium]